MTDQQLEFVNYYCGKAHFNATKAAELAGYAFPNQQGWRVKNEPEVAEEIAVRLKQHKLSSDEVLARLSEHARGTLAYFIKPTNGVVIFDLECDDAQEHFHLIKKAKTKTRTGGKDDARWEEIEHEIEIHDPQAALVHVGRHYGLFTDKNELTGADGKPIEITTIKAVQPTNARSNGDNE